jgi:hypothetical protein
MDWLASNEPADVGLAAVAGARAAAEEFDSSHTARASVSVLGGIFGSVTACQNWRKIIILILIFVLFKNPRNQLQK